MASSRPWLAVAKKKYAHKGESALGGQGAAKCQNHDDAREKRREHKRMRESAMPPRVAVADAEPESNNIKIWNNGADRADRPEASWSARAVEKCSDAESRHRM